MADPTPPAEDQPAPPTQAAQASQNDPSPPAAADTAAAPATGGPPPATEGPPTQDQASQPHREPSFLRQVADWASGKNAPTDAVSAGCLEDLRSCLSERQATQQQAAQLEQAVREQQAALFASQGREDALLRVLYRSQAK